MQAQSSYSSDATSLEGLVDTMSVSTGAGVILDLSLKGELGTRDYHLLILHP